MSNNDKKDNQILRVLLKYILPVLVIAAAAGIGIYQMKTGPKADKKPQKPLARLVELNSFKESDIDISINAMGTVMPARTVTISPEVTGVITYIDDLIQPGALITRDQKLYSIDDRDYNYIVKQRKAELAQATLNLKLEQGNQDVAKQEYDLLGEIIADKDTDLVLRKPHLQSAKAYLEASKALLEKANLDLKRCTVIAPFNSVVKTKHTELGTRVSPASPLVTLLGTDEYWIEVLVPVSDLKWIDIPNINSDKGSIVNIYNESAWGPSAFRQGKVLRLMSEIESQGRMAKLLVSIKDPLLLSSNKENANVLLVNSFVKVEIKGQRLKSVIPLKRSALREDSKVWIYNDGKLDIKDVGIVYRDKDTVYVTDGIIAGQKYVTSDIATPVQDMLIAEKTETLTSSIEILANDSNQGAQE